jgi:hypothetical protein
LIEIGEANLRTVGLSAAKARYVLWKCTDTPNPAR